MSQIKKTPHWWSHPQKQEQHRIDHGNNLEILQIRLYIATLTPIILVALSATDSLKWSWSINALGKPHQGDYVLHFHTSAQLWVIACIRINIFRLKIHKQRLARKGIRWPSPIYDATFLSAEQSWWRRRCCCWPAVPSTHPRCCTSACSRWPGTLWGSRDFRWSAASYPQCTTATKKMCDSCIPLYRVFFANCLCPLRIWPREKTDWKWCNSAQVTPTGFGCPTGKSPNLSGSAPSKFCSTTRQDTHFFSVLSSST